VARYAALLRGINVSAPPDPELLAAHDPAVLAPEEIRIGDRVI
jgi:hypothetical protein